MISSLFRNKKMEKINQKKKAKKLKKCKIFFYTLIFRSTERLTF